MRTFADTVNDIISRATAKVQAAVQERAAAQMQTVMDALRLIRVYVALYYIIMPKARDKVIYGTKLIDNANRRYKKWPDHVSKKIDIARDIANKHLKAVNYFNNEINKQLKSTGKKCAMCWVNSPVFIPYIVCKHDMDVCRGCMNQLYNSSFKNKCIICLASD